MAHIEFVDETFRDGQQSLWGMRMQAGMAIPIASTLDRTGFRRIEYGGSNYFEVMVRYCQEDPWAGMDAVLEQMPRTVIRSGMRSNAMATFRTSPDALMDVWMRQNCVHGVRSMWVYDLLYNIDKMTRLAKVAKEFGTEIAGSLMYTLSPVHDDAYYADKARKLSACPDIDTLLLYDTAGVLTKERMTTLIPIILANSNGKPLEYHGNNLLGMSAKNYLDAIELGVSVVHTASRPMANGPSVPSTELMVNNLEILGHTHNLDKRLFAPVADHMERVGKRAGFLVNQHGEYNILSIQHQIPGGMMGTLKAQLERHGMADKIEEVLAEVAVVRRELGYPGMATPFSQLVGIQAVLNLVNGERYKTIPDEIIEYALGYYGQTAAPIDADILDQILSSPRAQTVRDNPPEHPTLAELHAKYGTTNDDEMLLRAILPETDLEKMRAAGPLKRDYPTMSSPELEQASKLLKIANLPVIRLQSEHLSISLRA
jgi:oxaloacetate decarboxylase (Na+ extruding) subunit alpha